MIILTYLPVKPGTASLPSTVVLFTIRKFSRQKFKTSLEQRYLFLAIFLCLLLYGAAYCGQFLLCRGLPVSREPWKKSSVSLAAVIFSRMQESFLSPSVPPSLPLPPPASHQVSLVVQGALIAHSSSRAISGRSSLPWAGCSSLPCSKVPLATPS